MPPSKSRREREAELIELLDQVLASDIGLEVELGDAAHYDSFRQELYLARKTSPRFEIISVVTVAGSKTKYWLMKRVQPDETTT